MNTKNTRFWRFCRAFGLRKSEYEKLPRRQQIIVDEEYKKEIEAEGDKILHVEID